MMAQPEIDRQQMNRVSVALAKEATSGLASLDVAEPMTTFLISTTTCTHR